jgi:hypothetical protein
MRIDWFDPRFFQWMEGRAEQQRALARGFSFDNLAVTTPAFITGDSNEKWKEEASLDVCTGSRTEDNGTQESARCKNCQETKTV